MWSRDLGGKERNAGMKNVPHSLRHLYPWFPVGGSVWVGLGSGSLLGEYVTWWVGSEFSKPPAVPRAPLPYAFGKMEALSVLLPLPCFRCTIINSSPMVLETQVNSFELLWSWCFMTVMEN